MFKSLNFELFLNRRLLVATITAINLLVAFSLQLLTINIVGPGLETDALYIALSIPAFVLAITTGSISNVLIPEFSGVDVFEKYSLLHFLLLFFIVLGSFFFILVFFTIDFWLPFLIANSTDEGYLLTKRLCQIQAVSIPFSFVYIIQWSVLNAQKKDIQSELSPAIIGVLLFPIMFFCIKKYGVWAMAIWFPLKFILNIIALHLVLRKNKIFIPMFKKIDVNGFSIFWGKMKYLLFGSLYYKTEPIFDRSLLSSAVPGSLSIFVIVQQIYSSLGQIINRAIVVPSVSSMSNAYNRSDYIGQKKIFFRTFKLLFILIVPVFFVVLFFGNFIGDILFFYSGVSGEDSNKLSLFLLLLFGGFVGNVFGGLTSGAFYSSGKTKTVSYLAVVMYTIYIPLKFVFYAKYGVVGLSVLISGYALLSTAIIGFFFVFFNRGELKDGE